MNLQVSEYGGIFMVPHLLCHVISAVLTSGLLHIHCTIYYYLVSCNVNIIFKPIYIQGLKEKIV